MYKSKHPNISESCINCLHEDKQLNLKVNLLKYIIIDLGFNIKVEASSQNKNKAKHLAAQKFLKVIK